jgi:hypothetical protein
MHMPAPTVPVIEVTAESFVALIEKASEKECPEPHMWSANAHGCPENANKSNEQPSLFFGLHRANERDILKGNY